MCGSVGLEFDDKRSWLGQHRTRRPDQTRPIRKATSVLNSHARHVEQPTVRHLHTHACHVATATPPCLVARARDNALAHHHAMLPQPRGLKLKVAPAARDGL
eukprot:8485444-Alexandrium_andersonii.AAC.2